MIMIAMSLPGAPRRTSTWLLQSASSSVRWHVTVMLQLSLAIVACAAQGTGMYGSGSGVGGAAAASVEAATVTVTSPPACEWLPAASEHQRQREQSLGDDVNFPPKDVVYFTDGTNFDDVVTLLWLAKTPRANLRGIYLQGNACAAPHACQRVSLLGIAYACMCAGPWRAACRALAACMRTPRLQLAAHACV